MRSRKIVLVDDEKLIRLTTSMLLKHNGFETITANNGEEGIEVIREQMPDIVLLDVMMPGMSGWEVLRQLRSDERTASIFVIIFTACDLPIPDDLSEDTFNFCMLKKPFHLQQLIDIIASKELSDG